MSNGKFTRKSHIKRIYRDNDPTSDQWIDIERLDELRFVFKVKFPWHEYIWTFDWDKFDPDGDNVTTKKIVDPKDDAKSPDNVIKVPVRDMVLVQTGKEQKYQAYKHFFINTEGNDTRETHSRRIYHHDIDEAALDGKKNPPRDPEAYRNVLRDQDQNQYIDVEIIEQFWTDEHESHDSHGERKPGAWQKKKWVLDPTIDPLLRDPLLPSDIPSPDFSRITNPSGGASEEVAGSVTVDPPWRLDPLQNIVNVNWLGGLAVIFGEQASDAPKQKK